MNVSNMISTMRILGIGEVYNDDDSNRIALDFLNLAHDELYRETANINSNVIVKDVIVSVAGQTSITLTRKPFSISKIYRTGSTAQIRPLSTIDFAEYEVKNSYSGDPEVYYNINDIVNFYPTITSSAYTFNVWYVPERTSFNLNTPESSIPYPLSYQSVLVDGALYYLFQDESGFKNPTKENQALRRWTKGKADLVSYLYGSSRQSISTFENA
jgi:hypothetical protein